MYQKTLGSINNSSERNLTIIEKYSTQKFIGRGSNSKTDRVERFNAELKKSLLENIAEEKNEKELRLSARGKNYLKASQT